MKNLPNLPTESPDEINNVGDTPPNLDQWHSGPTFRTTQWTAVLAAGEALSPQSVEALEQLCRTYWFPLYAFVRRTGFSPEDAEDLTQAFFARFLEKKYFRLAERARGRFRTFLLTSLKHFLTNEWHRSSAAKRGAGAPHISFDQVEAERLYLVEPAHALTAEKHYERSWALSLLERARAGVRREYEAKGMARRFDAAEQFLPGAECTLTYAEAAHQLGVPEGTLKSDVRRIRQRYKERLRFEIANTVARPGDVADELRYLMKVLGE